MSGKQIPTQKNSAVAAFSLKTVIRLSTLRELIRTAGFGFITMITLSNFVL